MPSDSNIKIRRTPGVGSRDVYLMLENTLEDRIRLVRQLAHEIRIRGQLSGHEPTSDGQS